MDILIIWIIFCGLIAVWAKNWGRNPWVWIGVSILISPLITAIVLLIAGKSIEKKAEEAKLLKELSEK